MSGKLSVVTLGATMLLMGTVGMASAEGLLGANYVGGSLGMVQFGDDMMDDLFDNGTALSGFGNINLRPNLDLHMDIGYLWADGDQGMDISSFGAGADLVYFFRPARRCNPYLHAGLGLVKAEVEANYHGLTVSEDDTEVGFGGGGGFEFEASREVLLRGGLDYFNIDSEDSVSLSGSIGYWFNRQILGFVSAGYDFESEDKAGEIGLTFRL